MRDAINRSLTSHLLRLLEQDPRLDIGVAAERVVENAERGDLGQLGRGYLEAELQRIQKKLTVKGVVNPRWLRSQGLYPHFFLMQAEGGYLKELTRQSKRALQGTSQYILYGDWDSLLIFYGTEEEAKEQWEELESGLRHEPRYFSSKDVALLYRHEAAKVKTAEGEIDPQIVNASAEEYGLNATQEETRSLEAHNVILGPTWFHDEITLHRIIAFVGIDVRGREDLKTPVLLNLLQQDETLRNSLVHLYRTDQGRPFDFFAKLVCADMQELDDATNAIGDVRLASIRMEPNTMIVAAGVDRIPTFRKRLIRRLDEKPLTEDVDILAGELLAGASRTTVRRFNQLDADRKVVLLLSLRSLREELAEREIETEWKKRFEHAVTLFMQSAVSDEAMPPLTGAVVEATAAVEGLARRVIRSACRAAFGRDLGRAQSEFKLPTRRFDRLSLGKAAKSLAVIRKHRSLEDVTAEWSEELVKELELFAEERNAWAHDGVDEKTAARLVGRAERAIVDAMGLAEWLSRDLLPALMRASGETPPEEEPPELVLPERSGREFGVFIINSMKDFEIADRIATALKEERYPLFYAAWSIAPGDSIVGRIGEELAKKDTVVPLLSPESVKSKWVNLELNVALMSQLKGQGVKLLPVLIKPCEVPAHLREFRYIDMTADEKAGIAELMRAIRKRKAETESNSGG